MDIDGAVLELCIGERGLEIGHGAAQRLAGLVAFGPERDADSAPPATSRRPCSGPIGSTSSAKRMRQIAASGLAAPRWGGSRSIWSGRIAVPAWKARGISVIQRAPCWVSGRAPSGGSDANWESLTRSSAASVCSSRVCAITTGFSAAARLGSAMGWGTRVPSRRGAAGRASCGSGFSRRASRAVARVGVGGLGCRTGRARCRGLQQRPQHLAQRLQAGLEIGLGRRPRCRAGSGLRRGRLGLACLQEQAGAGNRSLERPGRQRPVLGGNRLGENLVDEPHQLLGQHERDRAVGELAQIGEERRQAVLPCQRLTKKRADQRARRNRRVHLLDR
jgi:hypothetical protein